MSIFNEARYFENLRLIEERMSKPEKEPLTVLGIVEDEPTFFYRIVAEDGTVFKCRPVSTLADAQEKHSGLIVGDPARWTTATIQMCQVTQWMVVDGTLEELVETSVEKLESIIHE